MIMTEITKYKVEIIWRNVINLIIIHLGAFYGAYLLINEASYYTIIHFYYIGILSSFGVQCGAHRLWCHRSYKAKLPLKLILMILDSMAGQTPIYDWCRDHRVHHKYSETDADPHNAKRGFFFAHCGWLLCKKHPDVKDKGQSIDLSDLDNDSIVQFQKNYYFYLFIVFWAIIPASIPCYLWGETLKNSIFVSLFFRYAVILNLTWFVNSAAHLWGKKPYDNKINPVECVIRHLMLGEGYHNYHHVFPWDYSASELGSLKVFNPATSFIDLFARIGWAYDLKKVPIKTIANQKKRSGSLNMTYYSPVYEIITGLFCFSSIILFLFGIKYILNNN